MKSNKPFAEVIESSLHGWLAQCWQWDQFPQFGSIISVSSNSRTIIGIVHQIQTGSMDPMRYPFAYQKTEQELRKEQPQIFEFLKTTFSCLTIGYHEKGSLYYLLAPEPPKIHSFVQKADVDITKRLLATNNYLPGLFNLAHKVFNLDELLLALLKEQAMLKILSEEKMQEFIQSYSLLTGNEYRRIKLFLQRVEQIIDRTPTNISTKKSALNKTILQDTL